MSSIAIITLSPSEWQKYKELRLEALQSDPEAFGRSYAEENAYGDEKWKQRLADTNVYSYFASADEKLVGMIGAKIVEEENKKVAVIMQMYVQKEQRGKGVGKLLMHKLLETLQKRNDIVSIQLDVNTSQENAVKLYQKMGFTIIKENAKEMGDGKRYNMFLMELNKASINFQ